MATIAMLHPPSRTYVSPWTGDFFGEGGVEKDLGYSRILASGDANVQGGVIMTKLGNATAKWVLGFQVDELRRLILMIDALIGRSLGVQPGSYCKMSFGHPYMILANE
jgi:hypothetical protein